MTTRCLTVALLAFGVSGCWVESDCDNPVHSWLAGAPVATRNAAGEPTIEIAGRAPDGGCGDVGGRTLVVVTASDIVIRERGPEEELPGPDPTFLGDLTYDYDDVIIELSWEPSFVEITIDDGSSVVVVECDAAPGGLPSCAPR